MEARDAVWLEAVAAPVVERRSQICLLLVGELDGAARAGGLECLPHFLHVGCEGEFLEQGVALSPRHLDVTSPGRDVYAVEPFGHRVEATA